jgi:hypothetical protein
VKSQRKLNERMLKEESRMRFGMNILLKQIHVKELEKYTRRKFVSPL